MKTLLELTSVVTWNPIYFAWHFDYPIWTKIGRNSFPSGILGVLLELLMQHFLVLGDDLQLSAFGFLLSAFLALGFRLSRLTGLVA